MLADPDIACVVPPWGGETAIDLVDLLDWEVLAAAEPTWLVGFSDLSTVLVPITTRLGWATIHGDNLADTPYVVPDGLLHWLDLAGGPGPFVQRDSGLVTDWVRFEDDPTATQWTHVREGTWELLGGGSPGRVRAPDRRLHRDDRHTSPARRTATCGRGPTGWTSPRSSTSRRPTRTR